MSKQGVLLVNLGTPDSPSTSDVRTYLGEFLMDGRVIDVPLILRAILVKGIIVPFRGPKSAKLYKAIWSDTTGSPLMHYSIMQKDLLQQRLGDDYHVELAMRYQNPSIESALKLLKDAQVNSIKVIPMFPHYASASTGSVLEKVMKLVRKWQTIPNISFINSFHDDERMIEAFSDNGRKHHPGSGSSNAIDVNKLYKELFFSLFCESKQGMCIFLDLQISDQCAFLLILNGRISIEADLYFIAYTHNIHMNEGWGLLYKGSGQTDDHSRFKVNDFLPLHSN
jgi:hypothetical protein